MIADPSVFHLDRFLAEERDEVERAIARACDGLATLLSDELCDPACHGLRTPGKRLRPILCTVAYRACGGVMKPAVYDLASSLELIHAYSLMHDDLPGMDDASLRRGHPTTHSLFGERATIRAGLALIPAASLLAHRAAGDLGCDDGARRAVVRELNRAAGAGGMVGGQALDLLAEGRRLQTDELDRLHRMKTGALVTASLLIGGIAAGAPSEALEGLESFGRGIGLAYQVTDDLLDATASAGELGKDPSDGRLGKSTYVGLHGLEETSRRARALVDEALEALRRAKIDEPALEALARHVIERKR